MLKCWSLIAPQLPLADISKLPKLPDTQTPVASCWASFHQTSTYLVKYKTTKKHTLGFYIDFNCTETQTCQPLVFLRRRVSCVRSNGTTEYLLEVSQC